MQKNQNQDHTQDKSDWKSKEQTTKGSKSSKTMDTDKSKSASIKKPEEKKKKI